MITQNKINLEAEFLAVLAQPTRLKILYFLRGGENAPVKSIPPWPKTLPWSAAIWSR